MGKRVEETEDQILARVDKMIERGLKDGSIVVEECGATGDLFTT